MLPQSTVNDKSLVWLKFGEVAYFANPKTLSFLIFADISNKICHCNYCVVVSRFLMRFLAWTKLPQVKQLPCF